MSIIQGNSKTSAAAAYEIDQSIRFNQADSARLTRTPASAGNRKTFTFSCWLKRGNISTIAARFFTGYQDVNNQFEVYFNTSDKLVVAQRMGGTWYEKTTDAVYRDPSAWYHFVWYWDTTDGTAGDRSRAYINGERVNFASGSNPSLNADGMVNATIQHEIAGEQAGSSYYYDGYIAEINFIDGQALDPTSFGEVNADTGQWVPKAYTGSYGTNGFYITGADSADLGADDSGNSNDFTSSGLTAADQVTDSPTDNYGVMNPLDNGRPSNVTLSDGNLTAAFSGAGYQGGIRSSIFFDSEDTDGFYAECTLDSLAFASIFRAGVANASLDLSTTDAQSNANGWAYSDQGAKLNNSYTTGYGSSVTVGDVVGIAVRNGKIYFAVNNTWQGSADPVTESNPAFSNLLGDVAFCQSTNTGGSYAHTATWNFGQTGFTYTPPTGYKSLRVQDLDDPTIADPSAYFQTTTYAGTGSTRSVDQSGNSTFEPGFVWIKARDAAYDHALYDQVRGATEELKSNASNAEATISTGLTAFESDGFQVGSRLGVNDGTKDFVAWQWAADGTSGSSNTDGSITSTVSANTTSGFSIVSYVGNATAGATVGHGLGAVPKMIIIKPRDAVEGFVVQHASRGPTKATFLNLTNSEYTGTYFWNDTAPTSSVFTLSNHVLNNGSGNNMIGYCFAEVEGFSKITFYESNSNSDGPFIYCGFRPSLVLIKNIDAAEDWWIQDAAREPFNGGNMARIAPNSSAVEVDNVPWFDFVSNGLKVRYNAGGINSSGTHIVMAFAESPFRYANAR